MRAMLGLGAAVVVGLLVGLAIASVAGLVGMAAVAWGLHGCWGRDCARGWEDAAVPIVYLGALVVAVVVAPIVGCRTGARCWRRLSGSTNAPQHIFYFAAAMAVPTVAVSVVLSNEYFVALSLALALVCGLLVLAIKVDDWASSR